MLFTSLTLDVGYWLSDAGCSPLFAGSDINNADPNLLKQLAIIGGWVFGIVMSVLMYQLGKRKKDVLIADQPIATSTTVTGTVQTLSMDKFATRDFCDMRHDEITRRLDGHDAEISALRDDAKQDRADGEVHASARSATIHRKIEDVRTELTGHINALRTEMSGGFKAVERSLGRIEGKVNRNEP